MKIRIKVGENYLELQGTITQSENYVYIIPTSIPMWHNDSDVSAGQWLGFTDPFLHDENIS